MGGKVKIFTTEVGPAASTEIIINFRNKRLFIKKR